MMIHPTRVLIVKTSSMGDVVHALPVVADLVRALPAVSIDWLVEDAFEPIPRLHPRVDRVIPLSLRRWRTRPFAYSTRREFASWRAQLRQNDYDQIIDCQGLLKSALVARVAKGPLAGYGAGSAREPLAACFYDRRIRVARELHAIERNRRLVAAAMRYELDGPPQFGLVPGARFVDLAKRAGVDQPYAVLLTNASRPTKLWPLERWAAVAQWLDQHGLLSLLFWGSAAEYEKTRVRSLSMPGTRVLARTTLEQAATLLAGAQLVIGLDTGLTHLAAALGAPTVGIYCDYEPSLTGVRGAGAAASLGGFDRPPTAEAVIEASARMLTEPLNARAG